MPCDAAADNALAESPTDGESGPSYDATSDRYTYGWQTDKAWAGTCRMLTLKLADGKVVHQAKFHFTR